MSGLWTRLKGSSCESMRISWQTTAKMVGGARSTAAAHVSLVLSSSGVLGTVSSQQRRSPADHVSASHVLFTVTCSSHQMHGSVACSRYKNTSNCRCMCTAGSYHKHALSSPSCTMCETLNLRFKAVCGWAML